MYVITDRSGPIHFTLLLIEEHPNSSLGLRYNSVCNPQYLRDPFLIVNSEMFLCVGTISNQEALLRVFLLPHVPLSDNLSCCQANLGQIGNVLGNSHLDVVLRS